MPDFSPAIQAITDDLGVVTKRHEAYVAQYKSMEATMEQCEATMKQDEALIDTLKLAIQVLTGNA